MFSNCLNYASLSGCFFWLLDHGFLAPDAVSFICKVPYRSNIECFNLVYQRETLCCCCQSQTPCPLPQIVKASNFSILGCPLPIPDFVANSMGRPNCWYASRFLCHSVIGFVESRLILFGEFYVLFRISRINMHSLWQPDVCCYCFMLAELERPRCVWLLAFQWSIQWFKLVRRELRIIVFNNIRICFL